MTTLNITKILQIILKQAKNKKKLFTTHNPKILLLSCCDARLDFTHLSKNELGEVFTVKNIGNIIPANNEANNPSETIASLEYGINILKVTDIIILGHSSCGAINGFLQHKQDNFNNKLIVPWLKNLNTVYSSHLTEEELGQKSILQSIKNLYSYPSLKEGVKKSHINIHGVYFNMEKFSIMYYNSKNYMFEKFRDD